MAEVSTPPQRGESPSSQDEQNGAGAQAQETASQAKDAAQEKAQEVAGQAREKAEEARQQASGKLREQVDERSSQAGEQVSSTASDLRSVAEELRKQDKETPAKLAEQAAERSERLGSYLSESDADRILSDVEDFARSRPWAVVAGGLVLGFAASRFLKASSSQRYGERDTSAGQLPSTSGNGVRSEGNRVAAESPTRVVATATEDGVEVG